MAKIKKKNSLKSIIIIQLFLGIFVLISLVGILLPKSKFELAKEQLITSPNNINAHLVLAEEYLNNNELNQAQTELIKVEALHEQLAQNNENSQVLGVNSWVSDLWTRWQEAHPDEINKLINRWRVIVAENLEYRDGYLRLALYYFKIGDDQKAKENLAEAVKIDPNFEPTKALQKIIE